MNVAYHKKDKLMARWRNGHLCVDCCRDCVKRAPICTIVCCLVFSCTSALVWLQLVKAAVAR